MATKTVVPPTLTAADIPAVQTRTDDDGTVHSITTPLVKTFLTAQQLTTRTVQYSLRWRLTITDRPGNLGSLEIWQVDQLRWSEVWTIDSHELPALAATTDPDPAAKAASWQTVLNALADRLTTIVANSGV